MNQKYSWSKINDMEDTAILVGSRMLNISGHISLLSQSNTSILHVFCRMSDMLSHSDTKYTLLDISGTHSLTCILPLDIY